MDKKYYYVDFITGEMCEIVEALDVTISKNKHNFLAIYMAGSKLTGEVVFETKKKLLNTW